MTSQCGLARKLPTASSSPVLSAARAWDLKSRPPTRRVTGDLAAERRHSSLAVGPARSSRSPVRSGRWLCDECWQVEELAERGAVNMASEVPLDCVEERRLRSGEELVAGGADCGVDGPAVAGVAFAHDEPALLQAVDGLGHRTLGDADPVGDLDHAQPVAWGHGHLAEHQVLGEG